MRRLWRLTCSFIQGDGFSAKTHSHVEEYARGKLVAQRQIFVVMVEQDVREIHGIEYYPRHSGTYVGCKKRGTVREKWRDKEGEMQRDKDILYIVDK